MNYLLFGIIFFIILVLACYLTWKTAEHHELHKVRAEFDDVLKKLPADAKEVSGIEYAEELIDEEDKKIKII